jgi:hypothetical protein
VSILDNQGHETATDGYGNYTFSGLPAGTYILWASKGGYKFSPSTLEVSLASNVYGQNFVGTPWRPVIVIPGTGGSANWPCFLYGLTCDDMTAWGWAPTAGKYYEAVLNHLRAAGYTEGNEHLNVFYYDWRRPPTANVAKLQDRINQVRHLTGSPTVDLVTHSQGGLVARAYIEGNSYGNDVAHLITLGTPHQGIPYLYPFWEAGQFYNIPPEVQFGMAVLMKPWQTAVLPAVFAMRLSFPSIQAMLPTFDYLRDQDHGDGVKPEVGMKQRNPFLPGLNDNLATLFSRTDVSTFAGTGVSTPLRFYVYGWRWYDLNTYWPNWDDGAPNWGREPQFRGDGDNTVPVFSAELPGAHVQEFAGAKHGDLPNTPAVADAVLSRLGIPHPAMAVLAAAPQQAASAVIVLALDGPASATVTDPLNRTAGPGGVSIPGAEYISNPGDPLKLILIPAPAEGRFAIAVEGEGSGAYVLNLLDTFNPPPLLVTDLASQWDSPRSQIEPGADVSFALTYTAGTSEPIDLMAETPMIQAPVWEVASTVEGRAQPGQAVEIRDADSQALLGSGTVGADGRYQVVLAAKLHYMQRIYPRSAGADGIPVPVGRQATFLPAVLR